MKMILLLVVCALFLSGCSNVVYTPPSECEGQESFILDHVKDPAALGKSLLAVNLAALELVEGYSVDQALLVLDVVEGMLYSGPTTISYAELSKFVIGLVESENQLAGAAVFIIGDYAYTFDSPSPISDCDIAIIKRHIEKQRVMLLVYSGNKG